MDATTQHHDSAAPFAWLAGTPGGLPAWLMASEADLLADAEQVVADDAMAWEPIEALATTSH